MSKPLPMQKAANKSVIQCPGCSTKFAIDSALLKLQEVPRFHCSKCDNVFAYDCSASNNEAVNSKPDRTDLQRTQNLDDSRSSFSNRNLTPPVDRPEVAIPSVTEHLVSKPLSAFDKAQDSNDQSIYSGALRIPNKIGSFHRSRAPMDYVDAPVLTENRNLEKDPVASSQASFDFYSDDSSMEDHFQDGNEGGSGTISSQKKANTPAASAADIILPASKLDLSVLAKNSRIKSSGSRAFGIAALPVGGFLLALIAITLIATSKPSWTHDLIVALQPSAPVVPPAGLYIDSIRFKKVVLDDGESVFLISGEIKNSTDKPFSDVQLEGQTFNPNGKLVSKIKASAASNLSTTRVKSLSMEMINNLQITREVDKAVIQAGAKQDFAIAIPANVSSNVAFYSARIYSARGIG